MMTPGDAYKNYYGFCRDSETWSWDFIQNNLKRCSIDYEEFNFEEFKDKLLTDDKFNERWSNGCTRELTMEERFKLAGYEYPPSGLPNIGIANLEKNNIPKRILL